MRRTSVRGGLVTVIGQSITVAATLAGTVVLARLLAPEAFGLVAMATSVTAFATLFRDVGLSAASVQASEVSQEQRTALFWLNIGVSATIASFLCLSAPVIASYFRRPELTGILFALSPQFVISGAAAQHGALLARELRFGPRAFSVALGATLTLVTAVGAAALGADYWALVIGSLSGTTGASAVLVVASKWRPSGRVKLSAVREMVRYGSHLTIFEIVNYFHRNLDNILIGRAWGASELGAYSRAYQLLMFPVSNIRAPINAVAFPVLSRLRESTVDYRRYFLRISFLVAGVTMPIAVVLFVMARDVVVLALGEAWLDVVGVFSVLALVAFVQPWAGLRGLVMMSMGQSQRYAVWGVVNAVAAGVGFVVGLKWKGVGVASAYAVVTYALLLPSTWWALRGSPVSQRAFFGTAAIPAMASVVSGLATLAAVPHAGEHPAMRVAVGALIFGVVYTACLLGVSRSREECRSIVRALRESWSSVSMSKTQGNVA